ncbi:MAG TPA: transporter substrate-binding domain-containing protein [Ruminiclostridium sp.]|nr:transporter substrate-binding domain-containing protein [Ruminiclostridium sp.]
MDKRTLVKQWGELVGAPFLLDERTSWGWIKMRKSLKSVFAVLTAALLLTASGCSSQKSLTVGISKNDIPLSFRGEGGAPDGFIVELSREAGRRMGMQINFKYVDMSEKSKNFTAQGVDVLWGKIESNSENRKTMLFTRDYIKDSQVIVVESVSKIEKSDDLKCKNIGAVSKSAAEKSLLQSSLTSGSESAHETKLNDPISAFITLDKNKIDALAIDLSYADNKILEHAEQYRILGTPLSKQSYAVAVRRNDARLRDTLEKALDEMTADGTSKSISKKWFGTDMTK